ncbi:MAG: tRNA dihydrouridine(20/20a) synthase DusA [Legionellaceae bacterium]|nr:tRNA dihydrouridine(20/20a) synthase DusA [Legionellaceae bacterium]
MHPIPHLISPLAIAPMIDWTYTHFRVFMRILAPHALLYTDMQTPGAIKHNPTRALDFHPMETPLALQLGGSDRHELVTAARVAAHHGYNEINLNLGCPSDRVQAGRFGACLMAEPEHVADCIRAMKDAVNIPVTAKTRIGIDHQDNYDFFSTFAHSLIEAGCDKLIVHARKAWLHGLSPKQNRTIPPVQYDYVYKIKQELPDTPIVINGNINTIDDIQTHLKQVDGVMLGRLACNNPYAVALIHHALDPDTPLLSRNDVLQQYLAYINSINYAAVPMSLLLKPLFNMSHGLEGARQWKEQLLSVQQSRSIQELSRIIAGLSH